MAAATAAALAGLALAGPAQADDGDGDVHPGESIQAAVDAAEPGDTVRIRPGTYEETVVIEEDGISLRGQGAVITPPEGAEPTPCDEVEGEEYSGVVSGICITGEFTLTEEAIEVSDRVSGVSVRGVTVRGASGTGLIAIATEDLTVRDSHFSDNGGYGAASFATEGTTFRGDVATGNAEAGFYVGDSPDAHAVVRDNLSVDNELGFFVRNASHGQVRGNVAEGNCLGVLVLADAPGPATDWRVRGNVVRENDRQCPQIPVSGAGIVLFGAQDFDVERNQVTGNDSTAESLVKGGIVAISGFGGTEPSGVVERNRAVDNSPADLVHDGTGNVRFERNDCETSDPEGLCD